MSEALLRALNQRYFHALDQRDLAEVGRCFTDDAVTVYLGGEWELTGRAALVERLALINSFKSSVHAPATMSFSLDGQHAEGTVYAVAYLAIDRDGESKVLVRGLRYVDDYVRDADGWRIRRRRQDPLWQYDVQAVPPGVPGQGDAERSTT